MAQAEDVMLCKLVDIPLSCEVAMTKQGQPQVSLWARERYHFNPMEM